MRYITCLARARTGVVSLSLVSACLVAGLSCKSGGDGGGGSGGEGAGGDDTSGGNGNAGAGGGGGESGAGGSAGSSGGAGGGGGAGAGAGAGGGSAGAGGTGGGAGAGGGGAAGSGGAAAAVDYFAYVGGAPDYMGTPRHVEVFSFNIATGAMTRVERIEAGPLPTYISYHPQGLAIYVTNESGSRVRAFAIAKGTGKLTALKDQASGGGGAVHAWTHPMAKFLLVANIGDGNVSTFPIDGTGDIAAALTTKMAGNGAHQIVTDPAGKFVFVPCKGAQNIAAFKLEDSGMLTPLAPATVNPMSMGPRHMAFHPTAKYAYLVTEEGGDVVSFKYDAATGALTDPQAVKMAPTENWGAHIAVTPDGKYLYASGRRTKTLYFYSIDGATGRVTANGTEAAATLGEVRDFHIESTGKFLLTTRQNGSTVSVFTIGGNGKLAMAGPPVATIPGPQTVVVVPVPKP